MKELNNNTFKNGLKGLEGMAKKATDKTTYEYGEELDLTGGSLKIKMASGAIKEEVELIASMVT